MPRCCTCGSAKTWSIVLIGPQGTPALLSCSTQNALGFDRTRSLRWAISAARFLARNGTVAKSGLDDRSLSPATSQNRFHRLSPEAALLVEPSAVLPMPLPGEVGWKLPSCLATSPFIV